MNLRLLYLIFLFNTAFIYTQNSLSILGKVVDDKEKPIISAMLTISDLNQSTFTNDEGGFSIQLPNKEFTLEISCLAYQTKIIKVENLTDFSNIKIILKEDLLELGEIIVTARKKYSKEGTSTYTIGSQSIKQIQAMNLSDVMSLLPGNKIEAPSLTETKSANIRTAIESDVNSFGTAIVVDGMTINNDANLQAINSASGTSGGDNATVASGVDLRSISLANVESIEVISGIASPKYGNLSSGVINVKSKVGLSPWIVSTNISSTNYQASVAKGFQFNNLGILNSDFSYAYSTGSPTEKEKYYQSFNLGLRWKLPSFKNLDWNHFTSFRVNYSDDGTRDEPEEVYHTDSKIKNISYQLGMSGDISSKIFKKIDYNISGSIINQYSYFNSYDTFGPYPIIEAVESGTYFTTYSPTVFNQIIEIEGKPINFNASIATKQFLATDNFHFNFDTGLQYDYNINKGSGKTTNGGIATSNIGNRAITFNNIPASQNLSVYHQTRITRLGEKSTQKLNLGVRYDNMLLRYNLVSPRLSLSTKHNNFSARAAWGVSYKAPAMLQLYPDKTYIDYINFNYYAENPNERLAIVTTNVYEPNNDNLKPNYVNLTEVGFDWNPSFLNLNMTFFNKEQKRGIQHTNELLLLERQNYEVIEQLEDQQPTVAEITGNTTIIPRTIKVLKNNYSVSTNGVELMLKPKKIKATNTEFNFRYSYLESIKSDTGYDLRSSSFVIGDDKTRYGVYENGKDKRIKSFGTLTLIQHIPALRFVLTLSAELSFREYSKTIGASIYPYAYYDLEGNYISIPEGERDSAEYSDLHLAESTYTATEIPFYANFNLQVRKETKQGHSFSFFAINAPWYNPSYENDLGTINTLSSQLSVGFNVSLLIN